MGADGEPVGEPAGPGYGLPARPLARAALLAVGLGVAWFVLARLSVQYATVGPITVVWPALGVAVAAVVLLGWRVWPVFVVADFLHAYTFGVPLLSSIGTAFASPLPALLGGIALRRMGFRPQLDRTRDVLRIALLAGVGASLLGATLGVALFVAGGVIPPAAALAGWRTWALSDVVGVILVAPPLLAWARPPRSTPRGRASEAAALAVLAGLATFVVFVGLPSAGRLATTDAYLVFPLLVWAALRFGPRGAASLALGISGVALAATVAGRGPFGGGDAGAGLLELQLFMALQGITALLLAATTTEREAAEGALRRHRDHLEEVVEDRTAALRATQARLTQLLENIREVFWMTDPAKNEMLYVSKGYERIWGRTCESLYASPREWLEAIHPDDRERVLHAATTKQAAGEYDEEYRILRPDGTERWVRDRAFPVKDAEGRVYRIVGIAEDVTARRRAQRAEQEKRLAEERLREAAFLVNTASHELNTPLTSLRLELDLLRQQAKLGDAEGRKTLRRFDRNVDRLILLVRDMIDVARMQSGTLTLKTRPTDLGAIALDAVEGVEESAHRSGVQLGFAASPAAWSQVDPDRLGQVVLNLLSNAVKFTPPGGRVTVTVGAEGDEAVLEVRDTGAGLTPEQMAKLFQPFSQVHDPKLNVRGSGLGLYISKRIVEQHGGRIAVASDGPGRGAAFTVALPLLAPEARGEVVAATGTPT